MKDWKLGLKYYMQHDEGDLYNEAVEFIQQLISETEERVAQDIEEKINVEIESGNIKVLKVNNWFKKLIFK